MLLILLGLLLMTGCYIAMGVFASSLTDNQIVAAVIGFGLAFLMWLMVAETLFSATIKVLSTSFTLPLT